MRVFITGTGRCGTSTVYQACKHMTNYTVGHETKARTFYDLQYPDNHIEVAAHLVIFLPSLIIKYPDAIFVHVYRNRKDCIKSQIKNSSESVRGFAKQWAGHPPFMKTVECAMWYYDRITRLVEDTFRIAGYTYTKCLRLNIDDPILGWRNIWSYVRAIGDYDASVEVFKRKYNTTKNRGVDNYE